MYVHTEAGGAHAHNVRKHNSAAVYLNSVCVAAEILQEDYFSYVQLKGWFMRQATHTTVLHEKNRKCAPNSWFLSMSRRLSRYKEDTEKAN